MQKYTLFSLLFCLVLLSACAQRGNVEQFSELPPVITNPDQYNELSSEESKVILNKGTEWAFSGAFHNYKEEGIYICKQCNNPLFKSEDKFDSRSGWPSFDDMIAKSVKEVPDADGMRTEIVCANCGGHLGHVFRGEGFTDKQTRHCVNSVSLNFVPTVFEESKEAAKPKNTDVRRIGDYVAGKGYEKYKVATFAGGCFWCTEAAFERIEGVVDVISGYSGGKEDYPTYEQVGYGRTTHAEAIMIYFDPAAVSYETLLDVFFTAHNPTQLNYQGPDKGPQYRSAVFYHNEAQKLATENKIKKIDASKEYQKPVVTEVSPYTEFWTAEAYHQDYYEHNPGNSYIQRISRPKVEKVKKKFANILKKEYRP